MKVIAKLSNILNSYPYLTSQLLLKLSRVLLISSAGNLSSIGQLGDSGDYTYVSMVKARTLMLDFLSE